MSRLEDEARPGQGPAGDVGADDGSESPPLEVRALESGVQSYPIAGRQQTIPELDVLDRWSRKSSGVESADRLERRAPDSSAPGPERRGVAVAPLVHEMMQEVPVAGDHAAGTRPRVVRAEDGRILGMVGEEALNALDPPRGDHDVGVDEEENGAAGAPGALIPGRGGARGVRRAGDPPAH